MNLMKFDIGRIREQNKGHAEFCRIHSIPEVESPCKLLLKSSLHLPFFLWDMCRFKDVEIKKFRCLNREGEELSGRMYGLGDDKPRPLIILDAGLRRDLIKFKIIGQILARMGYRAVSCRQVDPNKHVELTFKEALNYVDAATFLRNNESFKSLLSPVSAWIGMSGGGLIPFYAASEKEIVESQGIQCIIAVSTYFSAADAIKRLQEILADPNSDPYSKKLAYEYLCEIAKTGLDPVTNPEAVNAASPGTYDPKVLVPVYLFHGAQDGIVDFEGSIAHYQCLKNCGKKVELYPLPGKDIHAPNKEVFRHLSDFSGVFATLLMIYDILDNHLG